MKILADYHTHTIYSNGKNGKRKHAFGTIEENVQEAIKKVLKLLGYQTIVTDIYCTV